MAFEREIQACRKKIDTYDRHAVQAHGLLITNMVRHPAESARQISAVMTFSMLSHIAMRFMTTDKVGELKIKYGIPSIIQPEREKQVYANVAQHNVPFEPLVSSDQVVDIWRSIHSESVRRQEEQKTLCQVSQQVA